METAGSLDPPSKGQPPTITRRGRIRIAVTLAVIAGLVLLFLRACTFSDNSAGQCAWILLWTPCTDVPLTTFSRSLGIELPAGTEVLSSSSSGWDFHARMSATGTLLLPAGSKSPVTRLKAQGEKWDPFPASNDPTAEMQSRAALVAAGDKYVTGITFANPNLASGWITQGIRSNGTIDVSVSFTTSDTWLSTYPAPIDGSGSG